MQKTEKKLQETALQDNVKLIIDLHSLMVRTERDFVFSKKMAKLAIKMSDEMAQLQPKHLTLKSV